MTNVKVSEDGTESEQCASSPKRRGRGKDCLERKHQDAKALALKVSFANLSVTRIV